MCRGHIISKKEIAETGLRYSGEWWEQGGILCERSARRGGRKQPGWGRDESAGMWSVWMEQDVWKVHPDGSGGQHCPSVPGARVPPCSDCGLHPPTPCAEGWGATGEFAWSVVLGELSKIVEEMHFQSTFLFTKLQHFTGKAGKLFICPFFSLAQMILMLFTQ